MSSGTATPARPYQADFLREVERELGRRVKGM